MRKKREKILNEFGKMHRLLADEEMALLRKLEDEEKGILTQINENLARLGEQKSSLEDLIMEIKEKTQLSAEGMLKVSLCLQPHRLSPNAFAVWASGWSQAGWWAPEPHTHNDFSLLFLEHEEYPDQVGACACSSYCPGCLQTDMFVSAPCPPPPVVDAQHLLWVSLGMAKEGLRPAGSEEETLLQGPPAKDFPGLVVCEMSHHLQGMLPRWL